MHQAILLCVYFLFLSAFFFLNSAMAAESIYDFSIEDSSNQMIKLEKFSSPVLIVVNVASNCGYTYTNYRELTNLYKKYKAQGLEILGFPSNQFGEQEPGSKFEIQTFTQNLGVTFPIMAKIDVNGAGATDLFRFLKKKTGGNEINW